MSTTPLCTPDVLESSGPTVRTYVNATYKVKALCRKFLKTVVVDVFRSILSNCCSFSFLVFLCPQAFNRGKREGFFLKSVDNAPLAKRRKLKMTSTGVETRWSSSSSSSSSSNSSSAPASASKAQPKQTVSPKQSKPKWQEGNTAQKWSGMCFYWQHNVLQWSVPKIHTDKWEHWLRLI